MILKNVKKHDSLILLYLLLNNFYVKKLVLQMLIGSGSRIFPSLALTQKK